MNIEYYNFLLEKIKLRPMDKELSSNIHQDLECLLCGNFFRATPKSKVMNYKKSEIAGCPKCTEKEKYKSIQFKNDKKLQEKFEILSQDDRSHNLTQIIVKNKKCGHIFSSRRGNLLNRNVDCPVCNTERKRKFYQDINEERHKDSLSKKSGFVKYKQLVYKLTRDSYRKYSKIINPLNLKRARSGEVGYHLDHIVSVRYCFDNDVPAEICADYRNLRFVEWKINAKKWKKPIASFPDIFYPYLTSPHIINKFIEIIIDHIPVNWTKFYEFNSNNITLFYNNFAIIFAPLNDYREQSIGTKYHFLKIKKELNSNNIKSFIIYEDEWDKNPDLIIEKIKHYMNINSNVIKLYARNCTIKEISSKEKNIFLDLNHIQGKSISKINIGAFYNEQLVAVMTFCNPRIIMNKREINEITKWELARFATLRGYRITGIGSKLLTFFKTNYDWTEIYSFADYRWSEGNLYEQLKFQKTKQNKPSYSYIINNKRMHRWAYRKDAQKNIKDFIYDSTLTEYQNMLINNIDRIWDCGTLKFVLKK